MKDHSKGDTGARADVSQAAASRPILDTAAVDPQPGDHIDDYTVVCRLAAGGMGTVFVVQQGPDGEREALKLLNPSPSDDAVRSRFRREFRALSRLTHPNVLKVRRWGLLGDRPWYTMELVDGQNLRQALAPIARLDANDRFAAIRSILVQAARALDYVHDHGLVHRDVTPDNLMVTKQGEVKLMDFGLVKGSGADLTRGGEVLGTLAYAAPEQLSGRAVDARTDLYGLGAVLYRALTGRKPFLSHTPSGLIEAHKTAVPAAPRSLDPLVPADLEDICLRLLAKDPSDRFGSAAHLLHTLGEADDAMDAEAWPPHLIGRQPVKHWITDAADALEEGRGHGALLLTGRTGGGKTRLLDMAEHRVRRLGLRVLRGRCTPQGRPYGPFIDIYRQLVADIPEDRHPTVLRDAFGESETTIERYLVLDAFRTLLAERAPALVLVDSLQHANGATRELLTFLVRNMPAHEHAVCFLGGCSTEDARLVGGMADLAELPSQHLGPLSAQEVEELLLSLVDSSPAAMALARRLHHETSGHPSFLADTLRGLLDIGTIQKVDDRWEVSLAVDEISHSSLPMPDSVRAGVVDRIAALSEPAQDVARTLALARRALTLDTLLDASPLDEDTVMDALDELVDANIAEESRDGDQDLVELAHSRFREVLVQDVAVDALRRAHRRLGEALEQQHRHALGPVVEELAHHFEQAALPSKAYAYLLLTAQKHLQRNLHIEALAFLQRCLAIEEQARPHQTLDAADLRLANTYYSRAKANYHLGEWNQAIEDGKRAAALAELLRDRALASRVCATLGDHLRNQGHDEAAEVALRKALSHAKAVNDDALRLKPLYHLGAVRWAAGDLGGAELLWRQNHELATGLNHARSQGMAVTGLGILAVCKGRTPEARRQFETAAELFDRLGMNRELTTVRVNLIEIYLSIGELRRGLQLADKTIARAQLTGHKHGASLGLVWRAKLLRLFGRYDEARAQAREALRVAIDISSVDEEISALMALAEVLLDEDRAAEAVPQIEALWDRLQRHDPEDIAQQCAALRVQALAAAGDLPAAKAAYAAFGEAGAYPLVKVRTALDRSSAAFAIGELQDAIDDLARALTLSKEHGYRYYQFVAHHRLAQRESDAAAASEHARQAKRLAQGLAANLGRTDKQGFFARVGLLRGR